MTQTWYDQCMPRIKDIEPHLHVLAKELKKMPGVRSVYAWGSYVDNLKKKSFRVKDVDLLVKAAFYSEDLISITEDIINGKLDEETLWNEGYDSNAVKFSNQYVALIKQNIDPWVISSNRKLLHWGPLSANRKESDEVKQEAEEHATKLSGVAPDKLSHAKKSQRENWYTEFQWYLLNQYDDMPSGWYPSAEKITDIVPHAIRIA